MKGLVSPMDDSTSIEDPDLSTPQGEALNRALESVNECDIFCDALVEYMTAHSVLDSHDDNPVLRPAAACISRAAYGMVISAADFHCAQVFYNAQRALIALESEGA